MNTDKSKIQEYVERLWTDRARTLHLRGRDRLHQQAAFVAGAGAALQAVFGNDVTMTDYTPPKWIIAVMRSEDMASGDHVVVGPLHESTTAVVRGFDNDNGHHLRLDRVYLGEVDDDDWKEGDMVRLTVEKVKP